MKKSYFRYLGPILLLILSSAIYYRLSLKSQQTDISNVLDKQQLKILTWEGYADVKYVKQFEKENNVNVDVTYVKNDDDLWEKLNNNQNNHFDVIAANTAEIARYIKADLLQPIEVSNIENIRNQTEQFKDYSQLDQIFHNNKLFGVPYAYAEMGLIYNKKMVKGIPSSMSELWNTNYKGKVLAYDTYQHNFSLTAMAMGYKDPFNLKDKELKVVSNKLIELRKNVLGFYKTIEEANKIFRDYEIALVYANFGRQQLNELKKLGADVGYIIPNESALAWLDCWAIPKNASSQSLGEKWINFTLNREMSANLTLNHGLSNTIKDNFSQNDREKLTWLRPVNDPDLRKKIWDDILNGKAEFNL